MEGREKLLTASLILISKEKQQKLEAIKNLTMAQMAVSKQTNTDAILDNMVGLIDEKQKRIEEINILDENFKRLHAELESLIYIGSWQNASSNSNAQVRELASILERNTSIMREIQTIDLENTNKMQDNLKKIQEQLNRLRQGKKATYGYESYRSTVDAYFVDKKR